MFRSMLLASAALMVTSPALAAAPAKKAMASASFSRTNPFASRSSLPFQAPDFSRIKDSDYLPAIMAGMAQQKREIDAIARQKSRPTFDNTLIPLERSGSLLERAELAFSAVSGANTNDALDAVDTKTSPLIAQHNDYINLNPKLFARVKSLHDRQASLGLSPEQAKLLDVYYKNMTHAGAELSAAKQVQLKKINSRISSLTSANWRDCRTTRSPPRRKLPNSAS